MKIVIHVFGDDIISATKFRNSQSYWLGVASKRPVTITSGDNKVIVFNRERVHELYLGRHYLESAIKLCDEIEKGGKSTVYSWLEYLDSKERGQFQVEYINNILISMVTGKWDNIEELLEDWKATAETKNNPDVMKALKAKVRKGEYVTIK